MKFEDAVDVAVAASDIIDGVTATANALVRFWEEHPPEPEPLYRGEFEPWQIANRLVRYLDDPGYVPDSSMIECL